MGRSRGQVEKYFANSSKTTAPPMLFGGADQVYRWPGQGTIDRMKLRNTRTMSAITRNIGTSVRLPLRGRLELPFRTLIPLPAPWPVRVVPSTRAGGARTPGTRSDHGKATLALCASICTRNPRFSPAPVRPVSIPYRNRHACRLPLSTPQPISPSLRRQSR